MSQFPRQLVLTRLDGEQVPLLRYDGQVLLVVNTASQCGFTPQYEALEQLHRRYGDDGLAVLAFPCDQFGSQEPGGAEQIAAFCRDRYQVTFPLHQKSCVNGAESHPLFQHLKGEAPGLLGSQRIKWNFTKFLVNRRRRRIRRYAPTTRPEQLVDDIEDFLAEGTVESDRGN